MEYEMTDEQFKRILEACAARPLIMLQCGIPRSRQERANDAWKLLGEELGFDYMTVKPSSKGSRFFTAIERNI